jgi:hypothetical protein
VMPAKSISFEIFWARQGKRKDRVATNTSRQAGLLTVYRFVESAALKLINTSDPAGISKGTVPMSTLPELEPLHLGHSMTRCAPARTGESMIIDFVVGVFPLPPGEPQELSWEIVKHAIVTRDTVPSPFTKVFSIANDLD